MITDDDIRDDIAKYDRQITRLKCQLQDMPRASTRKDRKRVDKIHCEILHVEGLKQMAQDALNGKFENTLANKEHK